MKVELQQTIEVNIDINKLLTNALDLAEEMLRCNAEINRVEDTVIRICSIKSVKKVDVFAIKSLIIVTLKTNENETFTQTRRIKSSSTNLYKLEELNALSRYICSKRPTDNVVRERLEEVSSKSFVCKWSSFIGYILSAAGFCVFFGGDLKDAFATSLIAILIFYINITVSNVSINQIVFTAISSMIMGWVAIVLVRLGVGSNIDKIMIGDIMLLIPGIPTLNSIRDMLCGDILAGTVRLIEAALIAGAIACGCAFALVTLGGIV